MENVVLIIHLVLAVCLIGIVLLQRSEGGGLLSSGGGAGGGVMSGRAAATALAKLTWVFAILFIGTSIFLTIIAAEKSAGTSVLDRLGTSAPAPVETTPATPLGDNLLPPKGSTAPLLPPRAE